MSFAPIAIVGRACLLPGAHSPEQLWQAVADGRDLLSNVDAGRWRVPVSSVVSADAEPRPDRLCCDRGGYVRGFDRLFDAEGFGLPAAELRALDPMFLWTLHVCRQALSQAGLDDDPGRRAAVLGNLSFPSEAMARLAALTWAGAPVHERPDPRNRLCSSLPALLLRRALRVEGDTLCLDAACASSLYAVKLACDWLHDDRADLVLAGGLNRADDLFIHMGFSQLKALSPSGRSRPFHPEADGLVPAEGAGVVALRRLDDARRSGQIIYGVIRGVGLSNDGRGAGLLVPDSDGQVRALRGAYHVSGVEPAQISLLECHATGTQAGDAREIESMQRVFGHLRDLPIGSLKSNLGHLITAAGVAGLIKVCEALRAEQRPPSLHASPPSPALATSGLRVLHDVEPWPAPAPRRAGVSAFGFGGNNAHLIVEQAPTPGELHDDDDASSAAGDVGAETGPVALVGLGVVSSGCADRSAFARALFGPEPALRRRADGTQAGLVDEVRLPLGGLRFPPKDLQQTLAQQLLIVQVAHEALGQCSPLPQESSGVIVGMEADPEVARFGARWRAGELRARLDLDAAEGAGLGDAFTPPLQAAGVIGCMPNIVANRVSSQFDLGGPSYTVSAAECSGLLALEQGLRALHSHELDACLVGAVDLSCEPVHEAAAHALLPADRQVPGDAAVLLVLKRAEDARRDGDRVLALFDGDDDEPRSVREAELRLGLSAACESLSPRFGHAFAATGLLHVAAAALCLYHRRRSDGSGWPSDGPRLARVEIETLEGYRKAITLRQADEGRLSAPPPSSDEDSEQLCFAAHPPPVRVPHSGARIPRPALASFAPVHKSVYALGEARPMPAAPLIAPVLATTQQATDSAPPLRPRPAASPPTGAPPSEAAKVMSAQHAGLAAAHGAFLQAQSQAHRDFLRLCGRVERLAHAGIGAGQGARADTPTHPGWGIAPTTTRPLSASGRRAGHTRPLFDRADLLVHASGRISEIFGPAFCDQDAYALQVRMPEPPLLLADRVTAIEAEPRSMGLGSIFTETDVSEGAWYLHDGRMAAGLMIEAGQADLMLISYLGVDALNKGERVYRLLGCELTWTDDLPRPGETLCYDIHVDGHAEQGGVRLFFFHYDCRVDGQPRLVVRKGQAGFFTEAELAASAGVLWSPEQAEPTADARLDPPDRLSPHRAFDARQVAAFAAGRPWDCFGKGFERSQTHTRTPRIAEGRMRLLDEVPVFDPEGGPWGRGYLRAETSLRPDDWFFAGHFKNDPCMPGTLMLEGCLQALAFYLTATGYTLARDGWRFQPVIGEAIDLRCRGQVLPGSRKLRYEVFVDEIIAGPRPTIYADLLCSVDDLKALHARRVGLQLVPDWPLSSRPELLDRHPPPEPVARTGDFAFDHNSLLACAWGQPSHAFGPMYRPFDGERTVPRLPGPPYQFMSRVTRVEGEIGRCQAGAQVEVVYQVPEQAWYFDARGQGGMPFAVLLEAALQPCGWLASYVGSTLTVDEDLSFRNLDGTGRLLAEIPAGAGELRTQVELTSVSESAGMIIQSFDVACFVAERRVYEMQTVFGFFPKAALAQQVGLPTREEQRRQLSEACDEQVDLRQRPTRYFDGSAHLPAPMLLMIDRVTGFWAEGGEAGLGRLRAEKDVDPGAWFFKAHFFQDPVQPGSLGIEALLQLLQFYMLRTGMQRGIAHPRFEPLALDSPMTWKYRGQVVPENRVITLTLDVVERRREGDRAITVGRGSLWVDGKRIYETQDMAMAIVPGETEARLVEEILDPDEDTWLADHCPTWSAPALPLMGMLDRLARTEPGPLRGLREVAVQRWLLLDKKRALWCLRDGDDVRLLASDDNRAQGIARGRLLPGAHQASPEPWPALTGPEADSPYESGLLFHGPAFRVLTKLIVTDAGASAWLDAGASTLPPGRLNVALLDGATHCMPHDHLSRWFADVDEDKVAFPARIPEIDFFGPTPTSGLVRCEVRPDGTLGGADFPAFGIQLITEQGVWAQLRLVERCYPKGPIGAAPPAQRRAFVRDHVYVPELGLSRGDGDTTTLDEAGVEQSDWFPGTVAHIYGSRALETIAVKEHLAAEARLHPRHLPEATPLTRYAYAVERDGPICRVRRSGPAQLDLAPVRRFWSDWFGRERWPAEDIYYPLIERFVRRIVLGDPAAFSRLRGGSVLFLANHQVGVESLLFSIVASGLLEVPTVTLAKIEHRHTWLGRLIAHCFAYPGIRDPRVMTFFDREDPESLPRIVTELRHEIASGGRAVMVHVEGTRSLSCREPVRKMSGAFVDLAIDAGVPIVPVRFVGGLPVDPVARRLEFPVGLGQQEIWLGRPMAPADLSRQPYGERKRQVIQAINSLGPANADERPFEPDPTLSQRVRTWMSASGASHEHAVLLNVMRDLRDPCPEIARLLAAVPSGRLELHGRAHDRWLAELARRLFGPRGPMIKM